MYLEPEAASARARDHEHYIDYSSKTYYVKYTLAENGYLGRQ